jgi:hypothetical protein
MLALGRGATSGSLTLTGCLAVPNCPAFLKCWLPITLGLRLRELLTAISRGCFQSVELWEHDPPICRFADGLEVGYETPEAPLLLQLA